MYGYIYQIQNLVNGKLYIGQTTKEPEVRRFAHFNSLKNSTHKNKHFQRAYDKYGQSNFKFSVIAWFNSESELNNAEKYYINKYSCLNPNKGYNIYPGGNNSQIPLESRLKMSRSHTGKKLTKEHKLKISKATKGKNNPMYGMRGELSPSYGKHLSKEAKQRLSEFHTGKKLSNETKRKLSEYRTGRPMSEETKKKISDATKGEKAYWYGKKRIFSEEWRKNVSLASMASSKDLRKDNSTKQRGKCLFGFTSAILQKDKNPEMRCWRSQIRYKGKRTSLGWFNDPLSCEIVYFLVWNEIYN
jgi:group I intron endonuclease